MTQLENKTLFYYDFILSLPFLQKWETTTLKVPAFDVYQAFEYLEMIHQINVSAVQSVQVYSVSKKRGNTRIDFTINQKIDDILLNEYKRIFAVKKRKKLITKF